MNNDSGSYAGITTLRLLKEEHALLKFGAEKEGLRLATYLRRAALRDARKKVEQSELR